jgi:hypothetical protein
MKLKVSTLISPRCPARMKPMSRFDTIASTSGRLSAGSTTNSARAGEGWKSPPRRRQNSAPARPEVATWSRWRVKRRSDCSPKCQRRE